VRIVWIDEYRGYDDREVVELIIADNILTITSDREHTHNIYIKQLEEAQHRVRTSEPIYGHYHIYF